MNTPTEIALAIFRALPDPRVERTNVHHIEVIMFIALCTYLSGGDGFYDVEDYAQARQEWLRSISACGTFPATTRLTACFRLFPSVF